MKKQRITIHLSETQLAFLQGDAARLGITVADLIRRIVDTYREVKS
jgi:predicted DNA binding CopG/RHH family protein